MPSAVRITITTAPGPGDEGRCLVCGGISERLADLAIEAANNHGRGIDP